MRTMSSKSNILSRYILPRAGGIKGPLVEEYEQSFARTTGSRYAIGFMKGRMAFYAALKALKIGQNNEIIMPGYTCMVVPAAVIHLGAKPVYIDIEPDYCTLNPDKLEAALTSRTKAVMIQHTYGWPNTGMERIMDFCKQHGLAMIEDCCHALGTFYQERHVGNFGVAGFFSTQWSKPFTTGLGGVLVCNDAEYRDRIRQIRDEQAEFPSSYFAAQLAWQGIIYDLLVYPETKALAQNIYRWLTRRSIITGSTSSAEYSLRNNFQFLRMCEVQAAAGLYELRQHEAVLEYRRQLALWYAEELTKDGWDVPDWPENSKVTLLRFPLRVPNKKVLLQEAEKHFVELGDWFVRPLHSHLAPQEDFGYSNGQCPEAERAAQEIINLPTHPRVSRDCAKRIVRFLHKYIH